MVKVFTTGSDPSVAGDELTQMIQKWIQQLAHVPNIVNIHSNSNKYGWMVIVQYTF